jgi:ribosomal protein S18 acetylase RimI-like enzyme
MPDRIDPADASRLAEVRRFEAAGFRAWPAAAISYDGAWLVRLTAGYPAKRLNSVNPLDPGDTGNLTARIERIRRRFDSYGKPITFRLSPLSGRTLSRYLDEQGWSRFDTSLVMRLDLDTARLENAADRIPLKDVGRFTAAAMRVHGLEPAVRAGLSEVIASIQPATGLFVLEDGGVPLATLVCVHDGDLAGLFEVATDPALRGRGLGRSIVVSALKWAKLRGARIAWLQVDAGNAPARGLYESIGFRDAYEYHYRRPAEA